MVESLATFAGVSFQAASTATAVFELLTKYKRSIATLSGDTSGEKPVRPVPDRLIRG